MWGMSLPMTTLKCSKVCRRAKGDVRVENRAFWKSVLAVGVLPSTYQGSIAVKTTLLTRSQPLSPSRTWCFWKAMLAAVGFAEYISGEYCAYSSNIAVCGRRYRTLEICLQGSTLWGIQLPMEGGKGRPFRVEKKGVLSSNIAVFWKGIQNTRVFAGE